MREDVQRSVTEHSSGIKYCWMSHCQGSPSLVTLVPVCGIPVSQRLGSRMYTRYAGRRYESIHDPALDYNTQKYNFMDDGASE